MHVAPCVAELEVAVKRGARRRSRGRGGGGSSGSAAQRCFNLGDGGCVRPEGLQERDYGAHLRIGKRRSFRAAVADKKQQAEKGEYGTGEKLGSAGCHEGEAAK